ncbi:unknown [Clostridium sp. CAG:510]|nr:unknown [Clostridium sp. CAG:510]
MAGHRRCRIIQHAENHICVVVHRIYDTRHTRCKECRIAHESKACAFPINPVEALCHRDSGAHAKTCVNHIKRHRISKCITSDIATEIRFLSLHRLLHCIERCAMWTSCAQYRRTHRKRWCIAAIIPTHELLRTKKLTQNICDQIRTVLATCRHFSI